MDWRSSPECTELMPPMDDFSNSLLGYLIFLRIWSNGDSSPLGDVSLGCTSPGRASRPVGRS